MGPSARRSTDAHGRNPFHGGLPWGSRNRLKNPSFVLCAVYILKLVSIAEGVLILRGGLPGTIVPHGSSGAYAINLSQVRSSPNESKKQNADNKETVGGFEAPEGTEEVIPMRTRTKTQHQDRDDDERQLSHSAVENHFLDLGSAKPEKPPEQLGEDEIMKLDHRVGVRAMLEQSQSMIQTLRSGLAESQTIKEAENMSLKLRDDILKDVESLKHTLEQENENLGLLRQYEREQDALLKAQLGYLTPNNEAEEVRTVIPADSSSATFAGLLFYVFLACITVFYTGASGG